MKTLAFFLFAAIAAHAAPIKLGDATAVTTITGSNGVLVVVGEDVKQISLTNFVTVLSPLLGSVYDPNNVNISNGSAVLSNLTTGNATISGGSFSGISSGTFSNEFHSISISPTSIDFDDGLSLSGVGASNTAAFRDGNEDVEVFFGAAPGTAGGGTIVLNPADPISPPVAGQIYFDKTTHHFMGYDGTAWKQLDN